MKEARSLFSLFLLFFHLFFQYGCIQPLYHCPPKTVVRNLVVLNKVSFSRDFVFHG